MYKQKQKCGAGAVTQPILADDGVASTGSGSLSLAASVGSGSGSVASAAQRASAEAAMMAKALASLTAASASATPTQQQTGGSGGVNKPAILSAILRTAVPGKLSLSSLSLQSPITSSERRDWTKNTARTRTNS